MNGNPVILFDGECNLCNGWVQFVLKHDKKKIFRFGTLQRNASEYLSKIPRVSGKAIDSIYLIENGNFYFQSIAVLRILKLLGFPWSIAYVFVIIPPFIRNHLYRFVAANRYQWFGKRECMLPNESIRSRFLP
jgi:predicted DCC family thiol-disulfide oxidoreductase YuxK